MKAEKFEDGPVRYSITGIPTDMDEDTTMDLIFTFDGDALITLRDREHRLEITINNGQGGTHTNGLAGRLGEVADYLYNCQQDPDYAMKYMMKKLMSDNS